MTKKKKTELTEAQEAALSDEEKEALELPEEEEVVKEEIKEEVKEEVKTEEVKEEVKVEEVKKEEVKVEEVKKEDVEIPEQTATLLKERDIPIQTKNGKHFIPFTELEKARTKAKEFKAENEKLKVDMGVLSTRLEALEKPKAAEKPPEEKPPEVDLDEIERKIYDGEITPKEGFELVKKAEAAGKVEAETEPGEGGESALSPDEMAARVEWSIAFKAGLAEIYKEYPALKDNEPLNQKAKRFGEAIIEDALEGKSQEEQMAWLADPDNVINAGRQAAKEVTDLETTPKGSETFDAEGAEKRIREEVTAKLVTELNLKPEEVKTLSNVPSSSTPTDKSEELDAKSPEQLEEAMDGMSKEDRERFLDGKLE